MKKVSLVLFIATTMFGCDLKNGEEKKRDSGFKNVIYTKSEGPKI